MNGEGLRGRKPHGSGQDGYQAEGWWQTRKERRGVWCYANGSLVLLWRWAALAQETMSEKEKQ